MNSFKIVVTLVTLIFYNSAYPDTYYLLGEWNESIHPVITYHASLDGGFLSRWWDIDYPILYTGTSWGWGRDNIIRMDYRDIALRSLLQEFIALLDTDFSVQSSNAVFISQKSIADSPLIITQPGVYHLQESVTAAYGMPAIIVAADNVLVNLNRRTIHGCGSGADAVIVKSGSKLVTICNGAIRDAGANGIQLHSDSHEINLIMLDIQGSLLNGFFGSANRLLILDCKATNNNEFGFQVDSCQTAGGIIFLNCKSNSNGLALVGRV